MHSSRHIKFLLVPAITAFAACGGPADDRQDPESFGSAEIRLTAAPADVFCLRVQATGSRVVEQAIDVMPGQSTVFTMTQLPTGNVTFTGDAFSQSCSMITGATPTWIADPFATTIQPSTTAQVNLTMRRNGRANVAVDFVEDPTVSCSDGIQNGGETGIDCGGSVCMPCPVGSTCMVASDCAAPSICQNGVCVSGTSCMTNAECMAPQVCQGGQCVTPACMTNADCPTGTSCISGVCSAQSACTSDADCPVGAICQNGACVSQPGVCHAVINEVQVEGMGGSADEFIELFNPCGNGIDLSGYRVSYRSASGTVDVNLANLSGFFLPPFSFLLVASTGYIGPQPPDVFFPSNSLSATGGGIGLLDATNVVVDSVGYGMATNIYVELSPAQPAPLGQSIGRLPDGNDTNDNLADFLIIPPSPRMPN